MPRAAHAANGAAVAVAPAVLDGGIPSVAKIGKRLLRPLAEGLPLFGRVDLGQPDTVLLSAGVQNGERVAIGDGHHPAAQLAGVGRLSPPG